MSGTHTPPAGGNSSGNPGAASSTGVAPAFDIVVFAHAIGPYLAPAQASAAGASTSPSSVPIIQHLPNNTIKLPTFKGVCEDPRDKRPVKSLPATASSCLHRMDAFFIALPLTLGMGT
jgi:hypothetical protein